MFVLFLAESGGSIFSCYSRPSKGAFHLRTVPFIRFCELPFAPYWYCGRCADGSRSLVEL